MPTTTIGGVISHAHLDHVALAAERQDQLWPRYAGDLGGAWVAAGSSPGFDSAQLRYANGMKIETLEPYRLEENDFLRRFLDRNGPGPHHLTFKVPDIRGAISEVEAAGYHPVNVDLSDPGWMEAFIHPREVPGVVVQLAQSAGDDGWWTDPPATLPPPRAGGAATLVHAAHAVASLDDGMRLFSASLGGAVAASGESDACAWVDLTWPGPGRIRLLAPPTGSAPNTAGTTELDAWLAGRPGRFHHLAFTCPDPAGVGGAKPDDRRGVWVVEPEDNLGTRLLLAEEGSDALSEAG